MLTGPAVLLAFLSWPSEPEHWRRGLWAEISSSSFLLQLSTLNQGGDLIVQWLPAGGILLDLGASGRSRPAGTC